MAGLNDELLYELSEECKRSELGLSVTSTPKDGGILFNWELTSKRRGEANSCSGFDSLGECVEDCLDWAVIIRESREGCNPLP